MIIQKIQQFTILFLWLFTSCFFTKSLKAQCTGVSVNDSLELANFYYAIGGDNWNNNDGWLVEPVSEWHGITLSEDGCFVKEININYNNLTGELLDLNLPTLEVLSLSSNELIGTIPDFTNLPNLEILDLGMNNLNSNVLDFTNLPNLKILNLYTNTISLELPNFVNLPKLEIINLSANQLSGTIPDFNNLPNLKELYLYLNELTGTIPDFSSLPNLENLYLGGFWQPNQLTGTIPDFSNLPNLILLSLSSNELTGTIPDFSNLPNLEQFYASENQLSGTIPDFSNIPHLERLFCNQNQLTGNVLDFSNLPKLKSLSLVDNQLTGTILDFNNLPDLELLQISINQLTGTIPDFSNIPKLEHLVLSDNQLTGNIPNFSNLPNLGGIFLNVTRGLYVSNNQLTGTIPDFINMPNLKALRVDNNQLIGNVPDFTNLPNLQDLKVCDNNLFGIIPNLENCPDLVVEDIDFSCIQNAKIRGTIFKDENQDCIFNENEITIPQGKILVNDGNETYAFSDENGNYQLNLDIGTYNISYSPPNQFWQQGCLNEIETYTITIDSYEEIIENINFANIALADCALMKIDINTPLQRRCFNNTYTVQYCNTGTEIAEDVYTEIYFEEEIVVLDASIPYTIDDNEIYTFELGNIGIGECGSFTVTDSISCETVLGSAVCAMAMIYPNDYCRTIDADWDGSDIAVRAACLGNEVQFFIENEGEAMVDSSEYRMYEDDLLIGIFKFKLEADEELELLYDANGATYRLIAEQVPEHPSKDNPQVIVELCGSEPYGLGFVTSQDMEDEEPFYAVHCEEIIGSFDPNDKLVTPKGIGEAHNIEANTALEYKIRFQNTGNDTAFQVVVVDTLDVAHLDISTFEALNSSHDYSLEIVEGQILRFTFDNILLVDSNKNEPESHGFVSFKMEQMPDNPLGTVIENQAYIFFDYNQAILTPLAFSTIWEEPPFLETSIFEAENSLVTIYPNPATTAFYLNFSEIKQNVETAKLEIYDVFGRLVLTQNVNQILNKVDIVNIENGVYVYKIVGENAILGSGKIMIQ